MGDGGKRAYGFGLSRDGHIAFSAAYIAVLVTVGGLGVYRFAAHPPPLNFLGLPQHRTVAPAATEPVPVAFRARPVPDPASPHVIRFYPRVALLNRQEGLVVVRLLVLKTGEVGDVSLVRSSGYPQLDAAAIIETGNWRYLPAVRNGQAISAEIDVAVRFRLSA